jgi:hypothetical protein
MNVSGSIESWEITMNVSRSIESWEITIILPSNKITCLYQINYTDSWNVFSHHLLVFYLAIIIIYSWNLFGNHFISWHHIKLIM